VGGEGDALRHQKQRHTRLLAKAPQRLAPAPQREQHPVRARAEEGRDRDRVRAGDA
jgi:hypothetical protein